MSVKITSASEQTIGVYDAKTRFAKLVAEAEKGKSVTITRHGKAVARIVPVESEENLFKKRQAAIDELKTIDRGNFLKGLSIREMIDEGRR